MIREICLSPEWAPRSNMARRHYYPLCLFNDHPSAIEDTCTIILDSMRDSQRQTHSASFDAGSQIFHVVV
jgi:hypothetical protein